VDGAVNFGRLGAEESSYWFPPLQAGLVRTALLMLFGVVAFVGVYLFVR
jgi:hypothetical protein